MAAVAVRGRDVGRVAIDCPTDWPVELRCLCAGVCGMCVRLVALGNLCVCENGWWKTVGIQWYVYMTCICSPQQRESIYTYIRIYIRI